MSKSICYFPIKGIDDEIAKQIPSWNSFYVANLRGLYEEKYGISTTNIKTLIDFRRNLIEKDAKALNEAITNPTAAFIQLKEAFTPVERADRSAMIASEFSYTVDDIQNEYPNLDREDIIKGYIDENGKHQFGISYIYQRVFKNLKEDMQEAANNGDAEAVEKYRTVFKNWGALLVHANKMLLNTEGIKADIKLTFADDANINDFDENSVAESFVVEESVRDSWQEQSESISPIGRISVYVRRSLSKLPKYIDGEIEYDDLGYMRTSNPTTMHQSIIELLRGVQNETDMVRIFEENLKARPYLQNLLDDFESDPVLRTQFFVDMSKDLQLYSMQKESVKDGSVTYNNMVLNEATREDSYKKYKANLFLKSLNTENTIFEFSEDKAVVNKNAADLMFERIKTVLGTEENLFGDFNSKNMTNQDKINFYKTIFRGLGINISEEDYDTIIKNNRINRKLNSIIKDLPMISNRIKSNMDFKDLLSVKIGKESKEGFLEEKIKNILKVTDNLSARNKILSRVRFQGNTYYSDVTSSYLGRFNGKLNAYASSGNSTIFKSFLEEEFSLGIGNPNIINDSFFYDKDRNKIRNKWLADLYYSNLNDLNSFANNFTFKKFLGDSDQKFEDFNSKKQALTLINEYFSLNDKYAYYPVFILGDSGAFKLIKAPRYSHQTIVDNMYEVYLQEKELQRKIEGLKQSLISEGKSLGSLAKIDTTKFGLLPFLNNVVIDSNDYESSVKAAIEKHLEESFKEWKNNLKSVGLLDKKYDKYTYLNDRTKRKGVENSEEALEENLRECFENTKFATIMQMELMTISPIFYKNGDSTDLQKRYKEIHASGNRLSVEAINPYTQERFSNRNYENVMFIDDIEINPEETNPEFMEVIASVYGKNSDIYKSYVKGTSLTDGQGYRTLKSYRAVMGMAGKWNSKCENAYNRIEAIREEIRENNGVITEDNINEIQELMVQLQPLKPFLFTKEKMTNGLQIPIQMKYAEVVVIPELMKDGKLKDLMSLAESKDIDLVAATTTAKAVYFGSINVTKANDKQSLETLMNNASIHRLSYNDYVLQTNVPYHIQGSQLFATQSRKLIFANLRERDENGNTIYYDSYLDGKTVNTGRSNEKLNAYTLNRLFVSLISANIVEDYRQFTDIISDPEKVRHALTQMTVNNDRETKDNLRGYSKGTNTDFLMPLFEGGIEHDTSALLLSIFKKKVNKQKINGGSAVQVSAFGINGYTENDNLKFIKDPNNSKNILYAECEIPWDLSYTDYKGNKVDLQFSDWCNTDGSLKLGKVITEDNPKYKDYLSFKDSDGNVRIPLIEEQYPGILSFIAYRIPTEEKYSMLNLKIVRFTHAVNGGGTLKVPGQGTKIAGFDFDIDKLYFMRREYKQRVKYSNKILTDNIKNQLFAWIYENYPNIKDALETVKVQQGYDLKDPNSPSLNSFWGIDTVTSEYDKNELFEEAADALGINLKDSKEISWEDYDYTKPAWDKSQTRIARNNLLITLMQKRLEDGDTIVERTTPGGFTHASEAAKYIRRLLGIDNVNYDYSDPWTLVVYNQQNQVAGKLIGIFANQNTNHAISSLLKEFRLTKPIAFGNHLDGLSNLKNPNALTKELLAASVDAVKDPVLNFLNLNTITADSAGMLCRLGYSFEEIGLLMNQPIIRKLCDYCMEYNVSNISNAIDKILSFYGASGNYTNFSSESVSTKILEDNIIAYKNNPELLDNKDAEFVFKQAQVLELFRQIYISSKDVSNFVTNTKFTASNAVKSTFGGMYEQQDKVKKYITNLMKNTNPNLILKVSDYVDTPITLNLDINNIDEYMKDVLNNPFGYEQVMYDTNVGAITSLGRYYPYENSLYKSIRYFMSDLSKTGLDEETINNIHDNILEYIISLDENNRFNPDYKIKLENEIISAKDYYSYYVPIKIGNLLKDNPELKKLPIFNYMVSTVNENTKSIEIKIDEVGALTPEQKESIRESWEALFEDNETKIIAEELYMYSYYKSGFGFGTIGFNHLAPLSLKLSLRVGEDYTYVDFLNKVLEGDIKNINYNTFAEQFIINHSDNNKFVYKVVTPSDKAFIKRKVYENNIPASEFTLDYTKDKNECSPFIIRSTKDDVFFIPAIKVDNMLYIVKNTPDFNKGIGGAITYKKVDTVKEVKNIDEIVKAYTNPKQQVEENNFNVNNSTISTSTTNVNTEDTIVDLGTLSIMNLADELIKARIKSGYIVEENASIETTKLQVQISKFKEDKISDEVLKDNLIQEIVNLYKSLNQKCIVNGKEVC